MVKAYDGSVSAGRRPQTPQGSGVSPRRYLLLDLAKMLPRSIPCLPRRKSSISGPSTIFGRRIVEGAASDSSSYLRVNTTSQGEE